MPERADDFPLHRDRYHLPEPEWRYPNATINTYAVDSEPDFPQMREAPAGAPNVLLVLLDDPRRVHELGRVGGPGLEPGTSCL